MEGTNESWELPVAMRMHVNTALKNEYVLELNVAVTCRHIQHPGPVT